MGYEIGKADGVAFVLPKYESIGWPVRVGRFMLFVNVSADRFSIGFQLLEAGLIIAIGPVYFGACLIEQQEAAFVRLNEMNDETP